MKFYDILQLDTQVNKNLQQKCTSKKEKQKLIAGMFLRSVLIVLFAIVFISALSHAFGTENMPMAVSIFCILLGIRFVDFGYCIKDSLATLSLSFLILLIAPVLASSVSSPFLSFLIHLVSFFAIMFITCDKPEMGNGGLFSFAYIYLSGNPVYGDALIQRFYLTLTGLFICGLIFYVKHKDKNKDIRFIDKIDQFDFSELKFQWMVRMSLGVSAILALGMAFGIERFMWAGFACGSLLSEYSANPKINQRSIQRFIGVIAGSLLYYGFYNLLPSSLHTIIGPLGGFFLGFCVDYKYKTAMNCLGALMIASSIYGLETSIVLRISDTVIGIVFAFAFYYIYDRYVFMRFCGAKQTSVNR